MSTVTRADFYSGLFFLALILSLMGDQVAEAIRKPDNVMVAGQKWSLVAAIVCVLLALALSWVLGLVGV